MKGVEFPLFKTKMKGVTEKFDLTSVEDREAYFELKAGLEIRKLREYLKDNTFICYLMGKKNSGKGTYTKMLKEIVSQDRIEHFSIGDMIRTLDEVVSSKEKQKELFEFLEKNYRGYLPLKDIMDSLKKRSTKILLPTELILALVKMKISATDDKKALFIDGFPRSLDQISYSLFFRDLIGYRDDPDVFCLIDVPENVIDERIKFRVVCPKCQTSRSLKLLPTEEIEYEDGKYYLICDNPECTKERLVKKEGDEKGIELIRERLEIDEALIKKAFSLYGIPKVLLRNAVPVKDKEEYIDDYEATPEFILSHENGKVKVEQKPWIVKDDEGEESFSLMPPAVVVSFIKQLSEALGL